MKANKSTGAKAAPKIQIGEVQFYPNSGEPREMVEVLAAVIREADLSEKEATDVRNAFYEVFEQLPAVDIKTANKIIARLESLSAV